VSKLIAMAVALAVAVTCVTSCDGDEAIVAPTVSPSSPTTTSGSPTRSVTSTDPTRATAEAGAVAGYRRYIQVIDAMTASGGTKVGDIAKATTGIELNATLNQAASYRGQKIRTIGSTVIVWARPASVGKPINGVITKVTVRACYDTSGAKAVDASGKNVQVPGTPKRWLDDREMWLVGGVWKAYNGRNRGAKC